MQLKKARREGEEFKVKVNLRSEQICNFFSLKFGPQKA